MQDIADIAPRQLRELEAFLADYNTFEGNEIELTGWRGRDAALTIVDAGMDRWQQAHLASR